MTTACDENGYLTALKAVVVSDTGAYASLGGPVLQRACTHAAGPYNFQTIDIDGKAQIHTGASCIGQGMGTVMVQIVSETAELSLEQIEYQRPNTFLALIPELLPVPDRLWLPVRLQKEPRLN